MTLTIYNTLTRDKKPFEPIVAGTVRMYCCGVTVYDYCHLGHARSYIVWDTVRRYLQWRGYQVQYVQNFTDIDDKIIRRAREIAGNGENIIEKCKAITDQYIAAFHEDMERLNILTADAYPKATETIPQIIEFIQLLINRGYAYAVGGDVYYAVERFPNYGKLSGRKLEQMEAGASERLKANEVAKKRHPLDFALWKNSKLDEPAWNSPWGKGRPGWHIECSAMVRKYLGDHIDIHCGGEDLVFPHHENEIAQSEAALSQPLANVWMHNGFVKIAGEKMSKSLGNFTTIRGLLDSSLAPPPMALRLFILQAHYQKPIEFSEGELAKVSELWVASVSRALRFGYDYSYSERHGWQRDDTLSEGILENTSGKIQDALKDETVEAAFQAAMDDDFNTPLALAVLFELIKEINRSRNLISSEVQPDLTPQNLELKWRTLVRLSGVLGLELRPRDYFPPGTVWNETLCDDDIRAAIPSLKRWQKALKVGHVDEVNRICSDLQSKGIELPVYLTDAVVQALVDQRTTARKAKNFAEGDRIRNELQAQGITLIDQPGGETRWHRH